MHVRILQLCRRLEGKVGMDSYGIRLYRSSFPTLPCTAVQLMIDTLSLHPDLT